MPEQIADPHKKRNFILIALSVLVLGALFLILGNNVSGSTAPIREVADQFRPGDQWKLIYEEVIPPRFICWDHYSGDGCPQIFRRWETFEPYTPQELSASLANTRWKYNLSPECKELTVLTEDNDFICSLDARQDKYAITIFIDTKSETSKTELTFVVDIR